MLNVEQIWMVTMEENVDMEDTYLPAGIYAGCAGDMNSSQGEGSSWWMWNFLGDSHCDRGLFPETILRFVYLKGFLGVVSVNIWDSPFW